ncbi:hypothetical protein MMPV_008512 [Pyropia vietnamensis]
MTPYHTVTSTLPVALRTPHRRPVLLGLLFAAAALGLAAAPAVATVLRQRPGAAGAATTVRTPPRAAPGGWSTPYGVHSSAAAIILGGADAFPSASAVRSASVAHRAASSPPVARAAADPPSAAASSWSPTVHAVETADTCPCEVLSEGGMCIQEVGRGICTMRKCDPKWVCTAAGATMCHKRPAGTSLTCTVAFGGWGPNVVVCPCELLSTDKLLVEPMDRDQV